MINQDIAYTNEIKNVVSDSRLIAYGNKSIQLNIMEDVIAMYENSYLEQKELLEKEKLKLDELNYEVLSQENLFCEEVWRFSFEHDFSVIFKYYPFVKETNHCAKQEDNHINEGSSELMDLINEIDILKEEICNLKNGANIKQDVENALKNLQQLQLISDNITRLINLLSPLEDSHNISAISMPIYGKLSSNSVKKGRQYKKDSNCKDLSNKKIRGNQKELLLKNQSQLQANSMQLDNELNLLQIDKKKAIAPSENYSQLYNAKVTILKSTNNEKNKNFTLKKPSEISIKFQQYREHK